MPLQNRVTPTGELVATHHRGLFTGNRGIIHDPATRTLTRRWSNPAWLVCVLEFQGRRREVMGGRHWTELFFLDEASALAAGHRPCFHCRRAEAKAFRAAWAAGNGIADISAHAMDATLHRERLDGRVKRLHPLPCAIKELPDGAMLQHGDESYLVHGGRVLRWSWTGYHDTAGPLDVAASLHTLMLLTPPSTLQALRAGYRPVLHPSAG